GQSKNQVVEHLAGFVPVGVLLNNGDESDRVHRTAIPADFSSLFRTPSLHGRTLQADDAQPGREPVAVLSYGLWQRRFGGDRNAVGSKVMVGAKSTTIVGVMPPGFDYPAQSEIWAPLPLDAAKDA